MGAELCTPSVAGCFPPSVHAYKCRLFYGTPDQERVRYDNERGKGDHWHFGGKEAAYIFSSIDLLLKDFENDIQDWSTS